MALHSQLSQLNNLERYCPSIYQSYVHRWMREIERHPDTFNLLFEIERYFTRLRLCLTPNVKRAVAQEAAFLKTVFPNETYANIVDQLLVFGHLGNRVDIVMRLIIQRMSCGGGGGGGLDAAITTDNNNASGSNKRKTDDDDDGTLLDANKFNSLKIKIRKANSDFVVQHGHQLINAADDNNGNGDLLDIDNDKTNYLMDDDNNIDINRRDSDVSFQQNNQSNNHLLDDLVDSLIESSNCDEVATSSSSISPPSTSRMNDMESETSVEYNTVSSSSPPFCWSTYRTNNNNLPQSSNNNNNNHPEMNNNFVKIDHDDNTDADVVLVETNQASVNRPVILRKSRLNVPPKLPYMDLSIPVYAASSKNVAIKEEKNITGIIARANLNAMQSSSSPPSSSPSSSSSSSSREPTVDTCTVDDAKATSSSCIALEKTAVKKQKCAIVSYALSVDEKLLSRLYEWFPDAAPEYLNNLCRGYKMSDSTLNMLVTSVLDENDQYPKRTKSPVKEIDMDSQFELLKEFMPNADPDYLRMLCEKYRDNPDMLKIEVNRALEENNYPTLKDKLRNEQLSAQQLQYTQDFKVEDFVKLIPDPLTFFTDATRIVKMDQNSSHYASIFLRNLFDRLPLRLITSIFNQCKYKLYLTARELERHERNKMEMMKTKRKHAVLPANLQNIPLLQEIAYIQHKAEIDMYILQQQTEKLNDRIIAKESGLMKVCTCCYDDDVLPQDCFTCTKGCEFCRNCIVKSTEIIYGDGKLDFPCLMSCSEDGQFALQTLQTVLPPKLFSKIARKKVLVEVKAAGIAELEYCPFCDFASIPAEQDKVFRCLDPECMTESCRLCKEPSHLPLRCDEVEKDEHVKARLYVEDKMTQALLRTCWKCGIKFFKEDGCNKMTCSCGAFMCYICGKPVTDYKHFNGLGGDKFHLCPLYSDTTAINMENVISAAEEAKTHIGVKNDPNRLKVDPSLDVREHYHNRAKKLPKEGYLPLLQAQAQNRPR